MRTASNVQRSASVPPNAALATAAKQDPPRTVVLYGAPETPPSRSSTVAPRCGSPGPTVDDLRGFRRAPHAQHRPKRLRDATKDLYKGSPSDLPSLGVIPSDVIAPSSTSGNPSKHGSPPNVALDMTTATSGGLRSPEENLSVSMRSLGDSLRLSPSRGGPMPSPLLYDESSAARTAARNRCLFGTRPRKKLHPLHEEDVPYSVWPARQLHHQPETEEPGGGKGGGKLVNPLALPPVASSADMAQVLSRPQLLTDLTTFLNEELKGLREEFTDIDDSKKRLMPPTEAELVAEVSLGQQERHERSVIAAIRESKRGRGKHALKRLQQAALANAGLSSDGGAPSTTGTGAKPALAALEPRSREDTFRMERVRLFSEALVEFSRHFKSYRPLLLWVLREYDDFAVYCHRHVWSPEARESFKAQAVADAAAKYSEDRAKQQAEMEELRARLKTTSAALEAHEQHQASFRLELDEKNRAAATKDREIAESTEGRIAMLNRITRLEKELWHQRLLLEEPEKRIQELTVLSKQLTAQLNEAAAANEEARRDKVILRDRIERHEETIRDLRKKIANTNVHTMLKAEIMSYKKRELDILEMNAKLQAKVDRSEELRSQAREALEMSRGPQPSTPRPSWDQYTDVVNLTAPSTTKRVQELVGSYKQVVHARDAMSKEVQRLLDMLGSSYRDDRVRLNGSKSLTQETAVGMYLLTDDVIPDLRAKWFPKLGLDMTVPGYLKGVGKVPNLRYPRDMLQSLVRVMWIDRQAVRPGTSWDFFLSQFFTDQCPEDCKPDVFAYNVYHALQWYSFDPFIGFSRGLMMGFVDEAVFVDMQQRVQRLRSELSRAAKNLRRMAANEPTKSEAEEEYDDQPPPPVSKVELAASLSDACIDSPDVDVKQLVMAAGLDCPDKSTINIDVLFQFDSQTGRFSTFLEEFYRQYLLGRRQLLGEMLDAIYSAEPDSEARLCPPTVAAELLKLDAQMPVQYLDDIMTRLFNVPTAQLYPAVDEDARPYTVGLQGRRIYKCGDAVTADVSDIIAALQYGVVRRFTPPLSAIHLGKLVSRSGAYAPSAISGNLLTMADGTARHTATATTTATVTEMSSRGLFEVSSVAPAASTDVNPGLATSLTVPGSRHGSSHNLVALDRMESSPKASPRNRSGSMSGRRSPRSPKGSGRSSGSARSKSPGSPKRGRSGSVTFDSRASDSGLGRES